MKTVQDFHKYLDAWRQTIQFHPQDPIHVHTDGMCENQEMHLGIFISQNQNTLLAEHFYAGHGTCNEAEYIAVKTALEILKQLLPHPTQPIRLYSDSQLVVSQLNGIWRPKDRMRDYCCYLIRLKNQYPFEIIKIDREHNQIADSLAQSFKLKREDQQVSLPFERSRFTNARETANSQYNPFFFLDQEDRELLKTITGYHWGKQLWDAWNNYQRTPDKILNVLDNLLRQIQQTHAALSAKDQNLKCCLDAAFKEAEDALSNLATCIKHKQYELAEELLNELTCNSTNPCAEYVYPELEEMEENPAS